MPEPEVGGAHRKDGPGPGRWLLVSIVALGLIAVLGGVFLTISAGEVEAQRDNSAAQAADLGREVIQACANGDVVQSPDGRDLCEKAAQVQAEPVPDQLPAGVVSVTGAPGRPPTADEIRAVVNAYMAQNPPPPGEPGSPPSAAEVAAAVAQHLTANPPEPGRPPTAGEIEDAVTVYFATNPVRDGVDGQDGRDGRDPTAEEIQAAVEAELAENPPPAGPEGPPGRDGPTCPADTTLQDVQFADGRSGRACVFDTQPTAEPPPTTTAPPTSTEAGGPDDE